MDKCANEKWVQVTDTQSDRQIVYCSDGNSSTVCFILNVKLNKLRLYRLFLFAACLFQRSAPIFLANNFLTSAIRAFPPFCARTNIKNVWFIRAQRYQTVFPTVQKCNVRFKLILITQQKRILLLCYMCSEKGRKIYLAVSVYCQRQSFYVRRLVWNERLQSKTLPNRKSFSTSSFSQNVISDFIKSRRNWRQQPKVFRTFPSPFIFYIQFGADNKQYAMS